jgi:hypothetical protein
MTDTDCKHNLEAQEMGFNNQLSRLRTSNNDCIVSKSTFLYHILKYNQ